MIKGAQDFSISNDGRFSYVWGAHWLVTIELNERGHSTNDHSIITLEQLGYLSEMFTAHVTISPNGQFLYWAHNATLISTAEDYISVFRLENSSGEPQFIERIATGKEQGNSEIMVISPDGAYLYSAPPYASNKDDGTKDSLLIYTINENKRGTSTINFNNIFHRTISA